MWCTRIMEPGRYEEGDKEILGEVRQYLTIKILHNDMTVMSA